MKLTFSILVILALAGCSSSRSTLTADQLDQAEVYCTQHRMETVAEVDDKTKQIVGVHCKHAAGEGLAKVPNDVLQR